MYQSIKYIILFTILLIPFLLFGQAHESLNLAGIPVEFIIFGLILLGIALFHRYTLQVALGGLAVLLIYKVGYLQFPILYHITGSQDPEIVKQLHGHADGEWKTLVNLLGLLLGFELLASHFKHSGVPERLPHYLPDNWQGGFYLLILVAILSSFLDNIAAAMIGGTVANYVFKHKLHIGYIAAIVAASNAGGAGSVVGDTTTTMMWIAGLDALNVLSAFIAAAVAVGVSGYFASKQQYKFQPIKKEGPSNARIHVLSLFAVFLILLGAIFTNIYFDFPALGVWVAIIISAFFTKTAWKEIPTALKGATFLLTLVLCASLMPVESLPSASVYSTFGLGVLSSVFDNIPLTKLALDQGGYDWGLLAFAVGYGGSMIWFGSSAGVAITNLFPQARSVFDWIKSGWHVALGYVLGFITLYLLMGWHPKPL